MKIYLTLLALCFSSLVSAQENQTESNILNPEEDPHFNITFGISPFVGVLGFEYQNGNHAVGIGIPGVISYRHYLKPYQNTKFWGVYVGKHDIKEYNERVDGILFRDLETKFIGAGVGYRWQWPSGWNVSTSIAMQYVKDEYSNPNSSLKAEGKGLTLYPGINGGFKF